MQLIYKFNYGKIDSISFLIFPCMNKSNGYTHNTFKPNYKYGTIRKFPKKLKP